LRAPPELGEKALVMSVISSATILAALASVSLAGCATSAASRVQGTQSPSEVYRLCSDVRFRCVHAPADVQAPAMIDAATSTGSSGSSAPIQVDTNLASPARRPKLG
jgi:hypothetical protein